MPTFFKTFFDEKNIDREEIFEVEGPSGTNYIPYGVVIEHIELTRGEERAKIELILRMIDFEFGDVKHFLRHLGQGIAK